ncbi:hypothetical protein ACWC4D_40515 [Streptomyces sp. NPDC001288]|uniref:hypothetical protein n=1 Tax=unclassified Streptomyces TaxID=2593676 RepID=UPI003324C921
MTETSCLPSHPDPSWHGTANEIYEQLICAMGLPATRATSSLGEFTEVLVSVVPALRRAFGTRPHAFTYMFQALSRRDPDRIEEAVHVFIDLYVSEFSESRLRQVEGQ